MPAPRVTEDDALIEKTLEVFQPRTPRRLTREDAREIRANLCGFFTVLMEWDAKERARQRAEAGGTGR